MGTVGSTEQVRLKEESQCGNFGEWDGEGEKGWREMG